MNAKLHSFFSNLRELISSIDVSVDPLVLHGPFSLIHMEKGARVTVQKHTVVKDHFGQSLSHYMQGSLLYIPKSEVVCEDILDNIFRTSLIVCPTDQFKKRIAKAYSEVKSDIVYGDFMPLQLSYFLAGKSLNISKFLLLTILTVYSELNKLPQPRKAYLIFHPDIIFYICHGDITSTLSFLSTLSSLAASVNINFLFENVYFKKKSFRESLLWPQSPELIYDVVQRIGEEVGLCIDISHLERLGYTDMAVYNLLYKLHSMNVPILIHSRKEFRCIEAMTFAESTDIMTVFEPKRQFDFII